MLYVSTNADENTAFVVQLNSCYVWIVVNCRMNFVLSSAYYNENIMNLFWVLAARLVYTERVAI
ncbi:hypothetical protein TUM4261_02470 [Shewanella sp. c952]|nr:hypothetical protein TUM4261_02470 [Shewanella sp. c952]